MSNSSAETRNSDDDQKRRNIPIRIERLPPERVENLMGPNLGRLGKRGQSDCNMKNS
jgi:hypothetical protein